MRSKKVLLNMVSNLLLQFTTIIYGFIIPKIIITYYGSSINGLVSSITQFLAYIALLESGFGPVVKSILYKPIAKKNNDEIERILKTSETFFRNLSKIFIVYIVLLAMIYPYLINNEYDAVFSSSLIIIISISTFAEYYFGITYRLFLQADQKTYIISIIQIVTYLLNIVFIVLAVKMNMSIQMIKLCGGLIFVIRPLFQNLYVKRKYNINLANKKEKFEMKNKWDGLAQHIASTIHTNTDITILTIFCSLAEVSVYSIYYLIIKAMRQLVQSFSLSMDAFFGDMIAKQEQENLKEKFNMYEVLYFSIITILFSVAIIQITPFVMVYTKGISDANYIRYLFGYLIVISEFIWAIRQPYNELVKASGHFKETRPGAWVECFTNIIISVFLVFKFGIVGVAIGTIIAMTIRTIELVIHSNKSILRVSLWGSIKKIGLILFNCVFIVLIQNYIPKFSGVSYIDWLLNSVLITVFATVIVMITNNIFYRKELISIIGIVKNALKRKEKTDGV